MKASVWDSHRPDLDRLEIYDADTGLVYIVSADTFQRRAFRRNLPKGGEQIILKASDFREGEAPPIQRAAADEPAQLMLIPSSPTSQGTYFEKAKQPRPRLPMRRRW